MLTRTRLTDEQLFKEAEFLIEKKGYKVIELVYATDPKLRIDKIVYHISLIKRLLDKNGGGLIGINAEPFETYEYIQLKEAGLNFVVLWQETYNRDRYSYYHPGNTKKTSYGYRINAYDRILEAGIENIGVGVLLGLSDWKVEWCNLLFHENYLLQKFGILPNILGIPRLKRAKGATIQKTKFIPTDDEYRYILAVHNLFNPYSLPFINTREEWDMCIKIAQGGGALFTFNCSTIPGGYTLHAKGYQFPTANFDIELYKDKIERKGLKVISNWNFDFFKVLEEIN
ncbi:hydrogenase maturation protein hydg [hydrocarbon metagenome]|uniref:Hydrogenase maturation protein hydg n=1 Tax=hydrocarbon metagenome TaxID=938273 RepID=A0A0W8FXT2_9ZZZZ